MVQQSMQDDVQAENLMTNVQYAENHSLYRAERNVRLDTNDTQW